MLLRLLAAFILIPLMELFLLLKLADATSVAGTFGLVIFTGVLGSWLARREGVQAWQRLRGALASGRMPGREIQDGIMIAVAAALLLTPGLLTDTVGFAFLFPISRNWIRTALVARYGSKFKVQVTRGTTQRRPHDGRPHDDRTVEAKSVEHR